MTFSSLVLAALVGAAFGEPASPLPQDLLRQGLAPAGTAYAGRLEVSRSGEEAAKSLQVFFSPPGRYRRELLSAPGVAAQVFVSDGTREWIFDKKRNKVWVAEAVDPDLKRLGPEEEYGLLAANYRVRAEPGEKVAGRETWALELTARAEGRLSRKLWVDKERGLILRSELYSPDGVLLSKTAFTRVEFGGAQDPGLFQFSPPAKAVVPTARMSAMRHCSPG